MLQPIFGRADLLRCTQGIPFGENTPKLPAPPLLAFDEIVEIQAQGDTYGRGYALARKELASLSWVFDSHFCADPVMPGTMMLEGLLQLAGFCGAYAGGKGRGRVARIDDIRCVDEVTPEDREILYRVDVRRCNAERTLLVAEGKAIVRGAERMTVGSLWMVVRSPTLPH